MGSRSIDKEQRPTLFVSVIPFMTHEMEQCVRASGDSQPWGGGL